jgi:hypothetical protein
VYEILPGFVAALIAIVAVSKATAAAPGVEPAPALD